jgi:exonuclease VII large subunit
LHGRLKLLSPDNVLSRGYSITMDEATGRVLHGPGEAQPGQRLRTKLRNGDIRSVVED